MLNNIFNIQIIVFIMNEQEHYLQSHTNSVDNLQEYRLKKENEITQATESLSSLDVKHTGAFDIVRKKLPYLMRNNYGIHSYQSDLYDSLIEKLTSSDAMKNAEESMASIRVCVMACLYNRYEINADKFARYILGNGKDDLSKDILEEFTILSSAIHYPHFKEMYGKILDIMMLVDNTDKALEASKLIIDFIKATDASKKDAETVLTKMYQKADLPSLYNNTDVDVEFAEEIHDVIR